MRVIAKLTVFWGVAAIAINSLTYGIGATYDAGGINGLLWWSGQFLAFPAALLAEGLSAIGIDLNGYLGHMVIIIFLCLLAVLGANLAQRNKEAV